LRLKLFPSITVLAFAASITTSIVEPKFSNSADGIEGNVSWRVPAGRVVAVKAFMSMGDCWVEVLHAVLFGERAAQFVLFLRS